MRPRAARGTAETSGTFSGELSSPSVRREALARLPRTDSPPPEDRETHASAGRRPALTAPDRRSTARLLREQGRSSPPPPSRRRAPATGARRGRPPPSPGGGRAHAAARPAPWRRPPCCPPRRAAPLRPSRQFPQPRGAAPVSALNRESAGRWHPRTRGCGPGLCGRCAAFCCPANGARRAAFASVSRLPKRALLSTVRGEFPRSRGNEALRFSNRVPRKPEEGGCEDNRPSCRAPGAAVGLGRSLGAGLPCEGVERGSSARAAGLTPGALLAGTRRLSLAPRGPVSSSGWGGCLLLLHSRDGVYLERGWSCVSPVAMGRVAVLPQKFGLYGAKPENFYKSTTVFKSSFILKLCQPILAVTNPP